MAAWDNDPVVSTVMPGRESSRHAWDSDPVISPSAAKSQDVLKFSTQGDTQAEKSSGFLDTLKNPLDLWTKESLPAHVYNAYQKGTFNKPIGELVSSARADVKNFNIGQLVDAAKANPGQFAGELVNSIVADPELLFMPMGLGGKVAASLEKLGGIAAKGAALGKGATAFAQGGAKLVGQAGEAAVSGGAMMGGIDAAKQLDEAGYVDPRQVLESVKAGAGMGAAMVVGMNLGAHALNIKPAELWGRIEGHLNKGEMPEDALDISLKSFGASDKQRTPFTDTMREQAQIEEANALHQAKVNGLPEPKVKLSKREQARRAKESSGRAKSESTATDIVTGEEKLGRLPTQQILDTLVPELKSPGVPMGQSSVEIFNTQLPIKQSKAVTEDQKWAAIEQAHDQALAGHKTTELGDVLVNASAKEPGKYQVTFFDGAADAGAIPVKDHIYNTKADAIKAFEQAGPGVVHAQSWEATPQGIKKTLEERGYIDPDFVKMAAMEGKVKPGQGGQIDPALVKGLAMTSLAAAVGVYLADDPKEGALLGGLLAFGGMAAAKAGAVLVKNMGPRLQSIIGKDHRYRIDDMRRTYQSDMAGMKIDVARVAFAAKKMLPDEARRTAMTHFIETGKAQYAPKTAAESAYVKMITDGYKKLGDAGQKAGVLSSLIPEGSYITHLFGLQGSELQRAQQMFSSMSPQSKFAMHRTFPTIEVAISNGFKPITTDSAALFQVYGESLAKSIANKGLIDALKVGVHPDGRPLLAKAKNAPADYVSVLHPQLQWAKVNPEIAPSVGLLFTADNPNAISQALLNISALAKRSLFSFSMFHGMALTEAALAAQPSLLKGLKAVGQTYGRIITNKHWLEGEFGRNAEDAARAGVVLAPHKGIDAESDIFHRMLTNIIDNSKGAMSLGRVGLGAAGAAVGATYADDPLAGGLAGAAIGLTGGRRLLQGARIVDDKLNTLLWDKIHPTFKIITFKNQKEALLKKNIDLANKGKTTLTPQQINQYAASFTNDIFGGQNWVELAEGVQNKFGRDIMQAAASPAGRRGMSIGLLAPDWTVSTVRSITKAVPGVTDKELGALHRGYVVRSALAYLTIGDGLNVMFSGHHLWDNEDFTYIDLGDGRKMQLNKHFIETFHWAMHPARTFANKLGAIPGFIVKVAGDPKMQTLGQMSKEAVKRFTPIPISNTATSGEMGVSGLAGAMGLPITGKKTEQREADKLKSAEKRSAKKRHDLGLD